MSNITNIKREILLTNFHSLDQDRYLNSHEGQFETNICNIVHSRQA